MEAFAVVIVLVVVGVAGTLFIRRQRAGPGSLELENEANARFRPSSDSSDPECPRCHGRGVSGFPPVTCPVCHGSRHVRFGPDPT